MAIWDIFTKNKTSRYAIVDVEVGLKDHKIHDIGALRQDGATFHKASKEELFDFLRDTDYLCGHNIIHHDAQYLFSDKACRWTLVDTLYVSPLLFPERPYRVSRNLVGIIFYTRKVLLTSHYEKRLFEYASQPRVAGSDIRLLSYLWS